MDKGETGENPPEETVEDSSGAARREDAPGLQDRYYRHLIESTLDMLTVLDMEGRIVFNSPSLSAVLGYEPGELNGRYAWELVHPDDREALVDFFMRNVQVAGATEYKDYRFRHKDGSWRYLESIANNLLFDPEVGRVVVTSRDITERRRMEEELERREEHFRAVVENTMDLILIIDENAKIKYVNQASRNLLGISPEELKGTDSLQLVHPEEKEWARGVIGTAIGDIQYSPLLEVRVRHKDGSWLSMEGIGKNFLEHPAVKGIVLSFRDITDRKRVQEDLRTSEEMHRSLVAASPDCVTMTDLEGNIVYISPQTLQMHGYESEKELLGHSAFELIAPEDHAKAASGLQAALTDGYVRGLEFNLIRKGGRRFLAELNAALIRDAGGNPYRFVAYTRDISDRKSMEKELRDRNEELEAFAHTISHDLLTPVAIVEGYTKAALEADSEGRTQAERECLEAIARGARRMSDLINSLLQYAQAGHLDFESHSVDPEEVLMEVLMDLDEETSNKGVDVSIENELPSIRVDTVKLRQVFANLIGNAVKHMGNNPEPRVEVGASIEDEEAVFHVRDNGIGIPAELQKRIFEPFRHFSLTGSAGLGIGLSTVKRAVKTWGGNVWVDSQPGGGATFFFTAPLAL